MKCPQLERCFNVVMHLEKHITSATSHYSYDIYNLPNDIDITLFMSITHVPWD